MTTVFLSLLYVLCAHSRLYEWLCAYVGDYVKMRTHACTRVCVVCVRLCVCVVNVYACRYTCFMHLCVCVCVCLVVCVFMRYFGSGRAAIHVLARDTHAHISLYAELPSVHRVIAAAVAEDLCTYIG